MGWQVPVLDQTLVVMGSGNILSMWCPRHKSWQSEDPVLHANPLCLDSRACGKVPIYCSSFSLNSKCKAQEKTASL